MNKYQEAFDYIAIATNGADGIVKQMLGGRTRRINK